MASDGAHASRGSRRADRGRQQAGRASAGTAAAVLLTSAIIGFGSGALLGSASGSEADPASEPTPEAVTDSDPSSEQTAEVASEANEDKPTVEGTLTLSSPQNGGRVAQGSEGRIELAGSLDPPVGGVTLVIERSLDDGATWERFGDNTATTRDDGTYSYNLWSGREGDNHFRVVRDGPDGRLESNSIVVTVVAEDD